jgi:phosphoribosylanthranilate isomerase
LLGGTGLPFDWHAARSSFSGAGSHPRLIVAGGLNPENVGEAIATLRPWGVDVATGVEASTGKKDPAKVKAFAERARVAAHKAKLEETFEV